VMCKVLLEGDVRQAKDLSGLVSDFLVDDVISHLIGFCNVWLCEIPSKVSLLLCLYKLFVFL
jgi:hypothetical protein